MKRWWLLAAAIVVFLVLGALAVLPRMSREFAQRSEVDRAREFSERVTFEGHERTRLVIDRSAVIVGYVGPPGADVARLLSGPGWSYVAQADSDWPGPLKPVGEARGVLEDGQDCDVSVYKLLDSTTADLARFGLSTSQQGKVRSGQLEYFELGITCL